MRLYWAHRAVKTACCLLLATAAAGGVSDVLSVVARTLFVLLDQAQSSDITSHHTGRTSVRPWLSASPSATRRGRHPSHSQQLAGVMVHRRLASPPLPPSYYTVVLFTSDMRHFLLTMIRPDRTLKTGPRKQH